MAAFVIVVIRAIIHQFTAVIKITKNAEEKDISAGTLAASVTLGLVVGVGVWVVLLIALYATMFL